MLQSADMFGFPCVEYLKMTYLYEIVVWSVTILWIWSKKTSLVLWIIRNPSRICLLSLIKISDSVLFFITSHFVYMNSHWNHWIIRNPSRICLLSLIKISDSVLFFITSHFVYMNSHWNHWREGKACSGQRLWSAENSH